MKGVIALALLLLAVPASAAVAVVPIELSAHCYYVQGFTGPASRANAFNTIY